jgi:hypothetical protein
MDSKEEGSSQAKVAPTSATVVVKDLGKHATATKEMMNVYFTIVTASIGSLNDECKSH